LTGVAAVGAPVRLLAADGQPVVLAGIARVAEECSWLEEAVVARTGREAIGLARTARPDVLVMDVRLPDMLAVEAIRGVRARVPEVKVIVFTAEAPRSAFGALGTEGVDAFVSKEIDPSDLLETIGRVSRGEQVAQPAPADPRGLPGAARGGLTPREREILRRVALGRTNVEIAQELGLACNTVKTYFQRTLEKLGARNRIEALNRAWESGLL
jgi:two-component system, NarL family, nitrate/nitrite response regulator NarL